MIGLALDLRNERLNAIRNKIDAGGAAGKLCIYGGSRPYTGGSATTKLAEFVLPHPCADDAEDGSLIFDSIEGADAVADGKATWGRFLNSRGGFVMDCEVGRTDGDIRLKTIELYVGMPVKVTSGALNEGNG